MSIKTDPVKKDQLLSEADFLRYCGYDYHDNIKLKIDKEFLHAAQKDGFLLPLLVDQEKVQLGDGTEGFTIKNYYSPHQIYLMAALSPNIVYENQLWAPDRRDIEWYKSQGTRYVQWVPNGFSFNIDPARNNKSRPFVDIMEHCEDFYNFLYLLHNLDQAPSYESYNRDKARLFTASPSLEFNLKPLKSDPNLLRKYDLSLEKLNSLRRSIASVALRIDPMEAWYPFVSKLPQLKKDLLKGDALLAQELYSICNILTEMVEIITGKKEPPMLEFLDDGNFRNPYLSPIAEYATGIDIETFLQTIDQFNRWAKEFNHKAFVPDEILNKLDSKKTEIEEFKQKYGSLSIVNGVSVRREKTTLTLNDLDPIVRHQVDQWMKEYDSRKPSSQPFIPDDSDLAELLNKKEITETEARRSEREDELGSHITSAVEHRLLMLRHELYDILNPVIEHVRSSTSKAYDMRNSPNMYPIDEKSSVELQKEVDKWVKIKNSLDDITWLLSLVYCKRCRSKPVKLHNSHLDSSMSTVPLCDDCLDKVKTEALNMREEDWKNIREGEWKCEWCGQRTLYKFAHSNMVSLWTTNKIPIKTELIYGRLLLEAKCPQCGNVNQRFMDWGWST